MSQCLLMEPVQLLEWLHEELREWLRCRDDFFFLANHRPSLMDRCQHDTGVGSGSAGGAGPSLWLVGTCSV